MDRCATPNPPVQAPFHLSKHLSCATYRTRPGVLAGREPQTHKRPVPCCDDTPHHEQRDVLCCDKATQHTQQKTEQCVTRVPCCKHTGGLLQSSSCQRQHEGNRPCCLPLFHPTSNPAGAKTHTQELASPSCVPRPCCTSHPATHKRSCGQVARSHTKTRSTH